MGSPVLPALFEAEIGCLVRHEWARRAEDILRRRTKRGWHQPVQSEAVLDDWMQMNTGRK